jgi:hypothetical protein
VFSSVQEGYPCAVLFGLAVIPMSNVTGDSKRKVRDHTMKAYEEEEV